MKKKILYMLFMLNMLFNYTQTANAQDNQATAQKLRIDPAAALGGTVSQYIDSVKFITFESTKESQFGSIFQIEITDKYFIILDPETNAILIFTKQGKFHAKIKVDKNYHNGQPLYQFNFNRKTNLIEVPGYPANFIYDTEANLKRKIANEIPTGSLGVFKTSLGDKYLACFNANTTKKKDSAVYGLLIVKDGLITKKFLPYNINYKLEEMDRVSFKNFSPNFEEGDTVIYYVHNYDYNVYKLTPHTIKSAYQFIFPLQNSLPKDFTANAQYNNKRLDFVNQNSALIPRIFNFYKTEELLFFSTKEFSYILDTQSKHLICASRIVSDSLSYYLPITQAEVNNRDGWGFLNFDGQSFYTSYSSLILFDQAEATKIKNPNYPPQLAAYLSNEKNRKGNPVLVQIHFKSNL